MLLAPLLAAVLAAPVLVTDIDAARVDGELRVRLVAAGPLAEVRAEAGTNELVLHVAGATLGKERDTFHHHHRYIQARREAGGVRVEVPLGQRVSCAAAVQAAPQPDGLMVRTQCTTSKKEEGADLAAATTSLALAATTTIARPATTTSALPPATGVASKPVAPSAVAPKAAPEAAKVVAAAAAPKKTPVVELPALIPLAKAAHAPAEVEAAAKAAEPAAKAVEPTVKIVEPAGKAVEPAANGFELKPSAPPAEGNLKLVLPALVLAAAGGAALWLKKKRPLASRVLQIVETTSLGPKRSLIVARVGAETLLLSSSEAGITLLTALPEGTAASFEGARRPSAIAALPAGLRAAFRAAPADLSAERSATFDSAHQAAVAHAALNPEAASSLEEPPPDAAKASGPITAALRGLLKARPFAPAPSFETLFAESAEDQELRGKLRSGQLAHVR